MGESWTNAMAAEPELTIRFGASGNSQGYLGGGWARAEADFTWAVGSESHLILPRGKHDEDYILTMDVVPFIHEPRLPAQSLVLAANDTVIGESVLSRPSVLAYRIPAEQMEQQDKLVLTLRHPDAARPADFSINDDKRALAISVTEAKLYRVSDAIAAQGGYLPAGLMLGNGSDEPSGSHGSGEFAGWVKRRTGLTVSKLILQFESLGENCEFGLLQRRCNAEPLGLLRFSSTFLRNLIRGLDNGFDGLGKLDEVEPRLEGDGQKEFIVHEQRYGLVYHTFIYEGQRSLGLVREQEATRLKFLRRKFIEELEVSEKVFVYKRNSPVTEAEILPLFLALRRYGNNTLLWVVPAENGRAPGTVEVVMEGLFKGYIDRFAPDENAHALSFATWMKICANAYLLSRLRMDSDT